MTDMFNYSPIKVSFFSSLFSFPFLFASPSSPLPSPPLSPLPFPSLSSPSACVLSVKASNPFWIWMF